jgi:serine/threonine-protein kinase
MDTARWTELRRLFEAVCELPEAQWKPALQRLSRDAELIDEVLQLLEAQTVDFNRALRPLGELISGLSSELQPGDRLGPWQLAERLGSGGMGTVFVAERADQLFRQRVAIKLLHATAVTPATIERLAAERQVLAGLQHPNIARLFDGGTTPSGHPFLVMEYIDGPPLDRYCEGYALGLQQRLQLFLRVCRAVQAAHQQLVVHCDLKPSNILVRDGVAPVLLDFGISRLIGDDENHVVAGYCTPAYASPELIAGAPVGVVSDVFSLGVLLTELLAATRTGRTLEDRGRQVPLPSALAAPDCVWRSRLRGDLDAIAGRACALDAASRYPSVEALISDIERHLAWRPVAARRPTASYRLGRWLRRHWRESAVAAVAVLGLSLFVWRLGEERARAEAEARLAQRVSDFLVSAFDAADPRMRGARGGREPSARDVLDLGAARIEAELSQSPATLARMRLVLGRAYKNLGQPQRAQILLQQAGEGFLARSVNRPQDAIDAYNELSLLFSGRQDGVRAVEAARRAMALAERQGRADQIADAHQALGLGLAAAGDYAAAEQALQRAMILRTADGAAVRPDEHATALQNLAQLYRQRGDLVLAERSFRQALALRLKHAQPAADVQASLYGLAMALWAQGNVAEARLRLIENVELARTLYGEDSDRLANAHVDLANVLSDFGDYARSRDNYRRALAITARAAGRQSLEYARIQNNYSTLEYARGDLAAAEALSRQALSTRRRHLGNDEKRSLRTEAMLGLILARAGRLREAQPLVERPLEVWLQRYPDDEAGVLSVRLSMAEWLLEAGRLDEAAAMLRRAVQPRGEYNAMMLRRMHGLSAELSQRRGQWLQAVRGWSEVVALSIRQLGADNARTAGDRVPYAEVLLAQGDTRAAREQLRLAEAPLRRELVASAPLLRRLEAAQGRL